jgi:hypothetical protein
MVRGLIRVARGAPARAVSSARAEKRSVTGGTVPRIGGLDRWVITRHGRLVAISEADRAGLYNRLKEVLGTEESETFMRAFPMYDLDQVATKSDMALLTARLDSLELRLDSLESRMSGIEAKIDRFTLVLVAGLFGVIATLIGVQLIP